MADSLLAISFDDQLPKLDVAGSTPVSRSIFSVTFKIISNCNSQENGVTSLFARPETIASLALAMTRVTAYRWHSQAVKRIRWFAVPTISGLQGMVVFFY